MNNSDIVLRHDIEATKSSQKEITQSQSIFISSSDRNINRENTFAYNISFGNSSFQGGSIIKVFRNIREIEVKNVIIPDMYIQLKDIHSHTDNGLVVLENNSHVTKSHIIPYKKLSDCEYILMRIREFTQNNYGTNNYFNESFCVLKNDSDRCKNASNVYNYDVSTGASPSLMTKDNYGNLLLPSLRDKMNHFIGISNSKMYYTSTKGVLNNLEISFHLPNGKEIQLMNDYLTVSSVYLYDGTVTVATTSNLDVTSTATTLTANANGAISIDGVSLAQNDTVIVKDQTTLTDNGFYEVTTVGGGGNPYVLTRITTFGLNSSVYVSSGTVNSGLIYRQVNSEIVFRKEQALKIKTTRYFSSEEYKTGNTIKIADLTVSGANSNNSLNKFLENKLGHIIVNHFDSENSSNTLYNTLVIGLNYNYNDTTGVFSYDDFNMTSTIYSYSNNNTIINSDLQNTIHMDITYERYIDNFPSKLL